MGMQGKFTKWVCGVIAAMIGLGACTACCAPLLASIVTALLVTFGLEAYVKTLMSWPGLTLVGLVASSIAILSWRLTRCGRNQL